MGRVKKTKKEKLFRGRVDNAIKGVTAGLVVRSNSQQVSQPRLAKVLTKVKKKKIKTEKANKPLRQLSTQVKWLT